MDINGAKVLKKRLGPAADVARPAFADVPADAPPVYHWLGLSQAAAARSAAADDDEPAARSFSLFRR